MARTKDFNHLKAWVERQVEKTGLPVYKLANRSGVSKASIYAWMSDKFRPDSETLLKLAQAVALETGEDSAKLHAEALSQYVNRPEGRQVGTVAGRPSPRARRST